ncbi:MAG: hypothetical protein WC291_07395 [Thermodesulfovibrionales bacterium]|jgi:hypothetical protein
MKRKRLGLMALGAAIVAVTGLSSPNISSAEVDVNIGIGLLAPLPAYTFAAPPELVVIPGTYVYFAPDVDFDVFFYSGYWYRPYRGYWYRSRAYNGPWAHIGHRHVPRYLFNLPPRWRELPHIERIPYDRFNRDWRRWEKNRYWDRQDRWREWRDRRNREGRLWERERRSHFDRDRRDWERERRERRPDRGEIQRDRRELQQDRRELQRDKRELQQDRGELRRDIREGADRREIQRDRREIREGQREIKRDKRELREDKRELERDKRD